MYGQYSPIIRRKVYDVRFKDSDCFGEHLTKCVELTALECKIKFYQIIWAKKNGSFEPIKPEYEDPKFLKDIPKALCFRLGGKNFSGIPGWHDLGYDYSYYDTSERNGEFSARHRIYTNRKNEKHIINACSTSYSDDDGKTIQTLSIRASMEFIVENRLGVECRNFETVSEGVLF